LKLVAGLGFEPRSDDAAFDAEVVAEAASLIEGCDDVGDHIDALFLDAEGGDLEEAGGFDQSDDGFEG
jgi:hypothetical protein